MTNTEIKNAGDSSLVLRYSFGIRAWSFVILPRLARLGFLLIYCAFLFFVGLGDGDLLKSHEARAAQNAQMIVSDGCWGLPRLFDGHLEMQKPPLYYWLVAILGHLWGGQVSAWAVRLPAALSALGCVLFLYFLGRKSERPLAGFVAALVLASCLHFTWLARVGRIDMPLTLAVTVAVGCFYCALLRHERAWLWCLVGYVSVAVGILLKGPIAFALVGVISAAYLARVPLLGRPASQRAATVQRLGRPNSGRLPQATPPIKNGRDTCHGGNPLLGRPSLSAVTDGDERGGRAVAHASWSVLRSLGWGVPLIGLLAAPWFIWANHETGNKVWEVFFYYHNIERGLGGSETLASHPFWFYVPRAFVDLLPWSLALVPAAWYLSKRVGWKLDPLARLGAVWFVAVFALLSLMSFKRADYLLPAYPGAALFLGCVGEHWWNCTAPRRRLAAVLAASLLGAYALGWGIYNLGLVPGQEQDWPYRQLARQIRQATDQPVIFFRAEAHVLAFHIGRPLDTILEWENLDVWASQPTPIYFVMPPDCARDWPSHLVQGRLEEVLRTSAYPWGKRERPLVIMRSCPHGA